MRHSSCCFFVSFSQIYCVDFCYYCCQSLHCSSPRDWRSYQVDSNTASFQLSRPILLPLHTLSVLLTLAWPKHAASEFDVFSMDIQRRYGGSKPNLNHASPMREGGAPFWGSHHRVQITGPSLPGARCQANDRWPQPQMPALTGQWWTKRGKYRDREGVIPSTEGLTVSQREGWREDKNEGGREVV